MAGWMIKGGREFSAQLYWFAIDQSQDSRSFAHIAIDWLLINCFRDAKIDSWFLHITSHWKRTAICNKVARCTVYCLMINESFPLVCKSTLLNPKILKNLIRSQFNAGLYQWKTFSAALSSSMFLHERKNTETSQDADRAMLHEL